MSLREATRYYLLTTLFPVFFTPPLTKSISICSLVQGRIVHEFLSSDAVKHQCAERDAVHGDVESPYYTLAFACKVSACILLRRFRHGADLRPGPPRVRGTLGLAARPCSTSRTDTSVHFFRRTSGGDVIYGEIKHARPPRSRPSPSWTATKTFLAAKRPP